MEVEPTMECNIKPQKENGNTERILRRRSKKTIEDTIDSENLIISHHNPATTMCGFILLAGPRKGCVCGRPIWFPKVNDFNFNFGSANTAYCKAHYEKGIIKNNNI